MKKKITMLFAALLACVGVSAQTVITDVSQLSNDKVYSIVPKDATRGALYATSTSLYLDACGGTANNAANPSIAIDANSADQQFALYTHEGSMYLFSVGAGKFVSEVTENLFPLVEQPGNAVAVEASGEANYFIIKAKGTEFINVSTGWASGCVAGWNQIDDGNRLQITEVSEMPAATLAQLTTVFSKQVELTYVYKYGETEWRRETVTATKGEAYPAAAAVFGGICTVPGGVVADDVVAGTEVEIVCTLDEGVLPFQFAADYASIEHWYYMNIHADGYYLGYEEGQTSISLTETSVPVNAKDAYTWAFIGNPFNGFQIVNKLAGEGKILSSTTNTFDGNTGGNTYPLMTETPVAAGNNTYWIPSSSAHREKGFYLAQKDANGGKNIMNKRDGKLAYWNGGADGGSTFVVEERPMDVASELEILINEIEAMGIVGGENIGDYTVASVTALNEAVAAAKAVETATAEDVATLQATFEGLRIVLPDANKFYAFNCVYDNRKLYINANNQLTYAQNYDLTNSRAVFQFEEGSQPNTVKIKSVHNQSYMGAISGNPITFGATGADITIARSVSNELTDEQKPLAVMFTTDGTNGLHANGGNVQAYTNIAISNHYILSEVTEFKHALTIDEYDYMTLTLGFNAEVPEGVTAYKVTGTEGKELTLESVGTVIPAGEPVIVYAEVEAEGTKTAEFAYTTAEATKSGDNLLKGTLVDNSAVAPTTGYDAYVMALNGTEVVMGKATLNEGVFKNRANKAYLELPTVQDAPAMFSFGRGEGTTGIETAVNGEQTAVIYDLAGRRVEKMEKGIYIVNGKKVIK